MFSVRFTGEGLCFSPAGGGAPSRSGDCSGTVSSVEGLAQGLLLAQWRLGGVAGNGGRDRDKPSSWYPRRSITWVSGRMIMEPFMFAVPLYPL